MLTRVATEKSEGELRFKTISLGNKNCRAETVFAFII
jgi:hypothetical protein